MLGKIEGRRRGRQKTRWLDSISDFNGHEIEQTPEDSEGHGSLTCCSPWGHRAGHDFVTEQQKQLIYNIRLLSAVQKSASVIYIYISLFNILVPLWFIIRL